MKFPLLLVENDGTRPQSYEVHPNGHYVKASNVSKELLKTEADILPNYLDLLEQE